MLYCTYEELKRWYSRRNINSTFGCTVPMRNWNFRVKHRFNDTNESCTVPMRNWNRSCVIFFVISAACCTVPMRNWNILPSHDALRRKCAILLYCTYEELKLSSSSGHKYFTLSVVLYLWGIETSFRTLQYYQFLRRCTVPMRNWNLLSILLYVFFQCCTVPMRNWNIFALILGQIV